jgi:hypothetical protein
VTRFCYNTRVWPTNNISERDLRPAKTQQKTSGRLTSEDITQDRLDIRSYLDTARKCGVNVMTALHDAVSGRPWTPPLPAPHLIPECRSATPPAPTAPAPSPQTRSGMPQRPAPPP